MLLPPHTRISAALMSSITRVVAFMLMPHSSLQTPGTFFRILGRPGREEEEGGRAEEGMKQCTEDVFQGG